MRALTSASQAASCCFFSAGALDDEAALCSVPDAESSGSLDAAASDSVLAGCSPAAIPCASEAAGASSVPVRVRLSSVSSPLSSCSSSASVMVTDAASFTSFSERAGSAAATLTVLKMLKKPNAPAAARPSSASKAFQPHFLNFLSSTFITSWLGKYRSSRPGGRYHRCSRSYP